MNLKKIITENSKKYWYLFILIPIVLTAFWLRSFPARFNELQALDPFYIYRISSYVLTHNFQLPELDTLRYYPYGVQPIKYDPIMPFYFPAILYLFLSFLGMSMSYFNFALIYPAIMGALCTFIIFFIGKELFDEKAGLFAAFFLATTPTFIARTSAGFFEKEPVAGFFMFLSIYFFIRAMKRDSWVSGIISGLCLAGMGFSWGGVQYLYLLYAAFGLIMLILNKPYKIFKAYIPSILLGVGIPAIWKIFFSAYYFSYTSPGALGCLGITTVLVSRVFVERFNLLKEEQLPYFTPGMIFLGFLGLIFTSMFSEFSWRVLQSLINIILLEKSKGIVGSTVAENMPGDFGDITGMLSTGFASAIMPQIKSILPAFSLWIFMFVGMFLLSYKLLYTRLEEKSLLLIFPLLWAISGIAGVFGRIRLLFLLGPPAAICGGYFFSFIIDYALNSKILANLQTLKEKAINLITIPLVLFIGLVLISNLSAGYVYANSIGPSLTPSWKEAMEFLKTNTTEDSIILSWWDYGYWFQTVANRTSLADGGNLGGNPYGIRDHEIAEWFTSPASNWSEWEPWLENYSADYILVDQTLMGKYGAISKIASYGKEVLAPMGFVPTGKTYPKDNRTIYEFSSGPYLLWVPTINGTPSDPALLLYTQGGQYYGENYINEICTSQGIFRLGNKQPELKGCISQSLIPYKNYYIYSFYYVPEKMEHTIFTALWFMDGYGLPVEKVFDNHLIKIYKINYGD